MKFYKREDLGDTQCVVCRSHIFSGSSYWISADSSMVVCSKECSKLKNMKFKEARGPKLPELVTPRTWIQTNYESKPYEVVKVSGPYQSIYAPEVGEDITAPENYSLMVAEPGPRKKDGSPRQRDLAWLNGFIAQDGRFVDVRDAWSDEFVILKQGFLL